MPKKNFYGVSEGKGGSAVYSNWSDCKANTNGHSGATFKGFTSYSDAHSYAQGGGQQGGGSSNGGSSGSNSSYGSGYGGNQGGGRRY